MISKKKTVPTVTRLGAKPVRMVRTKRVPLPKGLVGGVSRNHLERQMTNRRKQFGVRPIFFRALGALLARCGHRQPFQLFNEQRMRQ